MEATLGGDAPRQPGALSHSPGSRYGDAAPGARAAVHAEPPCRADAVLTKLLQVAQRTPSTLPSTNPPPFFSAAGPSG